MEELCSLQHDGCDITPTPSSRHASRRRPPRPAPHHHLHFSTSAISNPLGLPSGPISAGLIKDAIRPLKVYNEKPSLALCWSSGPPADHGSWWTPSPRMTSSGPWGWRVWRQKKKPCLFTQIVLSLKCRGWKTYSESNVITLQYRPLQSRGLTVFSSLSAQPSSSDWEHVWPEHSQANVQISQQLSHIRLTEPSKHG